MQELQLELAAEYLNMAATLAEIKSRLLLPKPKELEDMDEGDPRLSLFVAYKNMSALVVLLRP